MAASRWILTSPSNGQLSLTSRPENPVAPSEWLVATAIGLALSLGVWWTLAQGGGLVGGDVYPYFLPQKIVLADSYARGEIPLWHNLTGLGYPLLAESQAGVFYPPNQLLYRLLDVNSAYNANVILHYWLAFVFAWRFARCQQIANWPAMFAALVFVYGWFPARISWEWSIFGGVFFPLSLWLTDRILARPCARRAVGLAACLATFLLSGHFTLAFITQLTAIAYAALSIWQKKQASGDEQRSWRPAILVLGAVLASLFLAAVQTVPTYELKRMSQRTGEGDAFDPAFGHMPPLYATQVVASWWYWHSADVVQSQKMRDSAGAIEANTNVVEAHLYWGLLPLGLMLLLFRSSIRTRTNFQSCRIWLLLMIAAGIYSTGWLMPIARHLPGFGFFNGPGRYTLVCSMGGAILCAQVLTALLEKSSFAKTATCVVLLGAVTLPDLLWSAEFVAHARAVPVAPLSKRKDSWIQRNLAAQPLLSCRLLAPGPNVGNLFGASCVPQYLGIGPSIYYDKELWPRTGPDPVDEEFPSSDQLKKLNALAITHIVTTEPVQTPAASIELVGRFPDSMLNAMWGRGSQPCFLYRLTSRPQRVVAKPAEALNRFEVQQVTANAVKFEIDLSVAAEIELRELMYPGWQVQIDEHPATAVDDTMMRTVSVTEGKHTVLWTFQPASFHWGLWISLISLLIAIAVLICPARLRNRLRFGDSGV